MLEETHNEELLDELFESKEPIASAKISSIATVLLFDNNSITKDYPVVGKTTVYMKRDENMGKCLIHSENFITPNMPKLHYAINFTVHDELLTLKDSLISRLARYQECHIFEKRDGFNCLFYKFRDRIIPKTRLAPIASGKIQQIIKLPEFPLKSIENMVRDGFVPIFEVWGTKLDEYSILHGSVNVAEVQEIEGLPSLNVDLIAVMEADYECFDYSFLPPDSILKLAEEYGLNHVKFYGKSRVTVHRVRKLMEEAEKYNGSMSTHALREGYVLHCYSKEHGYSMFKVKPYSLMCKDVIAAKTIPTDRIKLEISKVLVETDILEIARNPIEYIKQVIDYLSEDYKMTKRYNKKVNRVFVEVVASEFVRQYPECSEPWKLGVHKMLIGEILKRR